MGEVLGYSPDELKKIIGVLDQAKGVALKQIIEKIQKQERLTHNDIRIMKEYEAEFKAQREEAEQEENEEGGAREAFKNLTEVARFLKGEGWKVSQSTIYKHAREGKIRAEGDGTYTHRAVMTYAKRFLMTRDTRKKIEDEEIQRKTAKKELELKEERLKQERIKRMREEGKVILRED